MPLELTNEAAASVVDNSNESLVSVAVDSGSSSISSSLLPLNNEADQQINVSLSKLIIEIIIFDVVSL